MLHQAAKNHFDELGIKKLPSVKSLREEYTDLLEQKRKAYSAYKQAKNDMKELHNVRANVEWTDFKEYSSDVQLQIGQRIQKLRIDKKIAAVDLAAVLDIQSNQMSRIENGRANCTVPQLYVISQILGCSVDYLLFGKQCLTISQEQADSIKVLIETFTK